MWELCVLQAGALLSSLVTFTYCTFRQILLGRLNQEAQDTWDALVTRNACIFLVTASEQSPNGTKI